MSGISRRVALDLVLAQIGDDAERVRGFGLPEHQTGLSVDRPGQRGQAHLDLEVARRGRQRVGSVREVDVVTVVEVVVLQGDAACRAGQREDEVAGGLPPSTASLLPAG